MWGALDPDAAASAPMDLERLLPEIGHAAGDWELEIGFGKGRYLLTRAMTEPNRPFLGIELAAKYFRLARDRAGKRGLRNLVLLRGDALFLLSALLPKAFASAAHIYFPDPWPKARHHKRRLLDPETVDLLLGALRVEGRLFFATDHVEYGDAVAEVLASHPGVEVTRRRRGWPEGPRTNYEAKYMTENRPILRLELTRLAADTQGLIHPWGVDAIVGQERSSGSEA